MNEYSDEELEQMSDEELDKAVMEMFIRMICVVNLCKIVESARDGIDIPDEEQGLSYLGDFESIAKTFIKLAKPEYHEMIRNVHLDVYRNIAVKQISRELNWSDTAEE